MSNQRSTHRPSENTLSQFKQYRPSVHTISPLKLEEYSENNNSITLLDLQCEKVEDNLDALILEEKLESVEASQRFSKDEMVVEPVSNKHQ